MNDTLWLAHFDNFDGTENWMIFSSPAGNYEKAQKIFKMVYSQDWGEEYKSDIEAEVTELNEVDDYKIVLSK